VTVTFPVLGRAPQPQNPRSWFFRFFLPLFFVAPPYVDPTSVTYYEAFPPVVSDLQLELFLFVDLTSANVLTPLINWRPGIVSLPVLGQLVSLRPVHRWFWVYSGCHL